MSYFCHSSIIWEDFKNYLSDNFYDIFYKQNDHHSQKKQKALQKKVVNIFPSATEENVFLPNTERIIPYGIPYISNIYSFPFRFFIEHLICEENSSYRVTFVKDAKYSKTYYSIQFVLTFLTFDNVYSDYYLLYDLKTQTMEKRSCDISVERFCEIQKEILFVKTIYYNINKNPTSWRPKYFPIFSSSNEIINNYTKREHAELVGELSLLNNIGKRLRTKLHEKGILNFFDPNLFLELGEKVAKRNKNILYINHHLSEKPKSEEWKYIDMCIKNDEKFKNLHEKWKQGKILYLDFEQDTINSFVYLCGIVDSHLLKSVFWDDHEEEFLFERLYRFLETRSDHAIVYYSIDLSYYKKLWIKFFGLDHWNKNGQKSISNWYDLKYLTQEFCSFRGAYTFSIKDIIKTYSSVNACENPYDGQDDACNDGLESIFLFQEYQETKEKTIKEKLIEYNINDCIVQKIILEDIMNHVENKAVTC